MLSSEKPLCSSNGNTGIVAQYISGKHSDLLASRQTGLLQKQQWQQWQQKT
jgi:hypothetical protein